MQFSLKLILTSLTLSAALGLAPLSPGNDFSRMSDRLDMDGDFLAYVDLRGDAETFGEHLTEIYMAYLDGNPDAMPIPLDFAALFRQTGLSGVASLGYSSREIADDLYRNRGVVLLEGEPAGLLNIYDLTPRTFRAAEIAPSDASIAMDLRLDLVTLRDTLTEIAPSMMGPTGEGMIKGGLQHELMPSGLTGNDLLAYLSNSLTIVARQHLDLETGGSFAFYVEISDSAPRRAPRAEQR